MATLSKQRRLQIAGAGVVAFGILALVGLFSENSTGEHPLSEELTVDLCARLGDEIWFQLAYPAIDPIPRIPDTAGSGDAICALEVDPADPSDRWDRVSRGEEGNRVQQIAVVTLATTTYLRHQSPNLTTSTYFETFDNELRADGWERQPSPGPWQRGYAYSGSSERNATLFEDGGVVVWVVSEEVEFENLQEFSRSVALKLRQ